MTHIKQIWYHIKYYKIGKRRRIHSYYDNALRRNIESKFHNRKKNNKRNRVVRTNKQH